MSDIACKVGFLERPERVVLIIIGSLTEVSQSTYDAVASAVPVAADLMFYKMRAVMWVMAVLSHWTVIHRVYHTWQEFQRADGVLEDEKAEASRRDNAAAGTGTEVIGAGGLPQR